MPRAELITHRRVVEADGSLVEIKIWSVPRTSRHPHGFKYSLAYISGGTRLVGYDNAHGRDHRHLGAEEHRYSFVDPQRLIDDFLRDLAAAREKRS